MKTLLSAICIVAVTANVVAATPNTEVSAPIHQFIDSFNEGDAATAEAAHVTTGLVIIDEMPPYQWQGAAAFKTWLGDLTKYNTAASITDGNMRLGEVIREEISGDRAYVVTTAMYSFKANDKPMREDAQMTFALRKETAGWRISGWAFAGPEATPGNR